MSEQLFFKNKDYCYYLYAVAIGLLLWFFEKYVTDALGKVAGFLSGCGHLPFAIIIIMSAVLLSAYCLWKTFGKKKEYVSHRQIAALLLVAAVYSYYRFRKDSPFEFWGFNVEGCHIAWTDFLYLPLALRVLQAVLYKPSAEDKEPKQALLSDNAITTAKDDLFGYKDYVADLLSDINSMDLSESYSIGITGDWGQGKSSFLNLLKGEVEKQEDLFMVFSPRNSKNSSTIQEDFFKQLKTTLKKHHTSLNISFRRYTKALSIVNTGWLEKLFSAVDALNIDVENEKKAINNAIQRIGKRLYIIIEDFDRLTAEEIIEVLKVVDRNGDFSHTVYLAAYDKRYINSVLTQYFGNKSVQDYSDKYFQYEFSLPAQQSSVIIDFITKHLESVLELKEKVSKERIDKYLKSNKQIIAACLPSLRHAKRFLNIFCSRYPKIKEDVLFTDFFILTLLRYVDINAYYALARLELVAPSSFVNYQSKMYTLVHNVDNVLEEISRHKQSRTLLGLLFSKEEIEWVDPQPINRIRWVNSFDLYFYDYRPDRAYYKDLVPLFVGDSDQEAFHMLDEGIERGQSTDIEDFLCSRKVGWINNAHLLSRQIKLLCYLNHRQGRSVTLEDEISSFMEVQTAKEYASHFGSDEFKQIVANSFRDALAFSSVELGLLFIREIDDINDNKGFGKSLLFSEEELEGMAEWAQRYYYQQYGSPDFNFNTAFMLANIRTSLHGILTTVVEPAKAELVSLMQQHPEDFAEEIVTHQMAYKDGDRLLRLSFNPNFLADQFFPANDVDFDDWVGLLSSEHAQYVLRAVYKTHMAGTKPLQAEALQDDYKRGDFDAFYEAIQKDAVGRLDATVQDIIEECAVFDLDGFKKRIRADEGEIRASIRRLVDRKTVDAKYLKLKDRMDPFVEGDFVQLRWNVFVSLNKERSIKTNLFSIFVIQDDNQYKLDGWHRSFLKEELRPVFIDDEVSQNIYYDPTIAAPTVAVGQPLPTFQTNHDYFMKQFESILDYNDVSFKQRVEQKGFLYVHEVQHWLREEYGSDDLKMVL